MTHGVVLREDLPLLTPGGRGPIPGERLLECRAFGLAHLTLVLGETPPGQGTRLHRHSVEEVIVVHAGRGTFTLGETIVEVGSGEAVMTASSSSTERRRPLMPAGSSTPRGTNFRFERTRAPLRQT